MATNTAPPLKQPVVDPRTGLITTAWALYFQKVSQQLDKTQGTQG